MSIFVDTQALRRVGVAFRRGVVGHGIVDAYDRMDVVGHHHKQWYIHPVGQSAGILELRGDESPDIGELHYPVNDLAKEMFAFAGAYGDKECAGVV